MSKAKGALIGAVALLGLQKRLRDEREISEEDQSPQIGMHFIMRLLVYKASLVPSYVIFCPFIHITRNNEFQWYWRSPDKTSNVLSNGLSKALSFSLTI